MLLSGHVRAPPSDAAAASAPHQSGLSTVAAASLPLGPGLRKSGARQLLVSPHSQGQCGQSPLIVRDRVLARETLTCSFQLVLLVDSVSPLHRSSVFRAKACFPPGILSQLDDLRIGRWFVC